jgi:hypothetical protein
MSAIERELIEKISRLDADKQRKVLEFVRKIEESQPQKHYSAEELMKLPFEERNRIAVEALKRTANDDVDCN